MKPFPYVAALALVPGGGLLPMVVAPPAAALSCVGPATVLAEAELIVAGHVVDAEDGRILVAVDEVWRGDDVPAHLWLAVQLPGWSDWAGADGEVPAGHSDPRRWVLAPDDGVVNPCTAWRPVGELGREIRQHRPADPVAPTPASSDAPVVAEVEASYENLTHDNTGDAAWWPWLAGIAGGVVALLAGLGPALRRRTR